MGELINGRTPEDLKDALMRCGRRHCREESGDCPYYIDCLVGATRLKLMKDAFDYIRYLESERDAALAKVPKWISVEERLPEENQTVLVYADGCVSIAEVYDKDMLTDEPVWSYTGIGSSPLYWMPLPSTEGLK